MESKISVFEGMQYAVRYPDGYRRGKKYPVLLFLHGSGTRGTEIEKMLEHSFFQNSAAHLDLGFITVAPLCHKNTWFDLGETLIAFAKMIYSSPDTDPARLYLTGNSMGGYGAWQLAMAAPELFAAVLPVCGGGMYWNAGRLVNVPVWAFHGELDRAVLPEESKKMVDAVNRRGGNARLTLYPETAHNCWQYAYTDRRVYLWMMAQRNENTKAIANEYNNSVIYG